MRKKVKLLMSEALMTKMDKTQSLGLDDVMKELEKIGVDDVKELTKVTFNKGTGLMNVEYISDKEEI